eukprot:jgi/Tetstr1/464982/TSEL_009713.t1
MSMETAVPIDFQQAWAEAQRCVNERVVAAGEADDPVVVLDRALKWKDIRMTERRVEERAVVDNMKEAYVSVLALSRSGVGISAGDSVLIHGVRFITESLGAPLATASFRVVIHPEV